MKIGFHLRSGLNEGTITAAAIASVASDSGYHVEVFPRERSSPADPAWDRYLVPLKLTYEHWLKKSGLDFIVFVDPPERGEIYQARADHVRDVLLVRWGYTGDLTEASLGSCYRVVSPTLILARHLTENHHLKNVRYAPLDLNIPLTRSHSPSEPGYPSVHIPLHGCCEEGTSYDLLSALYRILSSCSSLSLTLSAVFSIPNDLNRDLKRFKHDWGSRVNVLRGISWDRYRLEFGKHDLTAWPATDPGLGLEAQLSIGMGVPLLTFDHPAAREFVENGRNGLLVPCPNTYNWGQVPKNQPDYRAFEEKLFEAVREPRQLLETFDGISPARREAFCNTLREVFDG